MWVSALLALSLAAIRLGTVTHYLVLRELERAHIPVKKYFSNVGDSVRAYRTYARLAREKQWPLWPIWVTMGAYLGLPVIALTLFLDRSLMESIARLNYTLFERITR
jgi:hypothetical protein